MPTVTIQIDLPEFTDEEIRDAVLRQITDKVLGSYIDDDPELIEGRRGDDPDDFRPSRKRVDGGFIKRLREEARELVTKEVKRVVESRVTSVVDEVLAGTFQPVTKWGDLDGGPTTLRAMIGKFGTDYLNAPVDGKGDHTSYEARNSKTTRLHFLINQMIPQVYTAEIKGFVQEQANEVKRAISGRVSGEITETVQRILGLPVTLPTTGALQANVSTIPNPPKS